VTKKKEKPHEKEKGEGARDRSTLSVKGGKKRKEWPHALGRG